MDNAQKTLTDITLDGHFSPAEAVILNLADNCDVDALSTTDQPPAAADENDTTSTLRRLLSLSPKISAVPNESRPSEEGQTSFRNIGAGQCGAVFSCPPTLGQPYHEAWKFAKVATSSCSPAQKQNNLESDYYHHVRIYTTFRRFLGDTQEPRNLNAVEAGSSSSSAPSPESVMMITIPKVVSDGFSFAENIHDSDASYRELMAVVEQEGGIHHPLPTDILKTERIPPLSLEARHALIDRFLIGSEEAKQAAKNDPANADCLVRVYLGANKDNTEAGPARQSQGRFFSLRNFKLHLNQLADLGLHKETLEMAKQMAFALAIMHWAAKTDGRDVEFVLGSSRGLNPETHNYSDTPEPLKAVTCTQLWLLDFNQCRPITYTKDGVAKMVEAVKLNDPYFPKPLRESAFERAVWTVFVRAYLAASNRILEEELTTLNEDIGVTMSEHNRVEIMALPTRFIQGVIMLERGRIEQRGGSIIPSYYLRPDL
ncbi:Zinc finger domain containing protein [Naviculisporaceae sp. PSN 640]